MEQVVTFLWRGWLRGRAADYLPGALRRHSNNRKYVACKLRFPHTKEFPRKLSTNLHALSKWFSSPFLGLGHQITGLPGAPTCFGPNLIIRTQLQFWTTLCYIY